MDKLASVREQAIELIATEMWNIATMGLEPWQSLDESDRSIARADAERILAQMLMAHPLITCPTCKGSARSLEIDMARMHAGIGGPRPTYVPCQNPDCEDGFITSPDPLILLGPRAIVLSGGNYPDQGGPTVYCASETR